MLGGDASLKMDVCTIGDIVTIILFQVIHHRLWYQGISSAREHPNLVIDQVRSCVDRAVVGVLIGNFD